MLESPIEAKRQGKKLANWVRQKLTIGQAICDTFKEFSLL